MTDREVVLAFSNLRVAVVGDLMMDEYVWGAATRVSPESPVLVIDVERESAVPGGAANVAANVVALGASAQVFGAVGNDSKGQELREALLSRGTETSGVITDDSRPTTRKTRVVAQNQQVVRVDREKTHDMPENCASELAKRLIEAVPSTDVVLASDYAKGVINALTIPPVIRAARSAGKLFVANGKPDNVLHFAGANVLSLNLTEAVAASGDKGFLGDGFFESGRKLRERLSVDTLIVTRGSKGLAAWRAQGDTLEVPAHRVEVYDVAGAGDTVISTLALALAAGSNLNQATRLAVLAAAVVVGKVGVATVSAEELLDALGPQAD